MKLVEILARELPEWPGNRIYSMEQAIDGEVIYNLCTPPSAEDGDYEYSGLFLELAKDWDGTVVARNQWEAERARIEAMEASIAFSQEKKISEFQREKIAKEWWEKQMSSQPLMLSEIPSAFQKDSEQELWDRVAVEATQAFIAGHITHFGHENAWQATELVSCAADYADAFMAERAKRLKERQ